MNGSIGIAIFSEPNNLASGGAAMLYHIPFNFSAPEDLIALDSRACWMTNLAQDALDGAPPPIKRAFRGDDFLPTTMSALAGELAVNFPILGCELSATTAAAHGIFMDGPMERTEAVAAMFELGLAKAPVGLEAIYEVVQRTFSVAGHFRGFPYTDQLPRSLSEAISDHVMFSNDEVHGLPEAAAILTSILSPHAINDQSSGVDARQYRIPLQRVAHCQAVLLSRLPSSKWHDVALTGIRDPLAWIQESTRPIIALVSTSRLKSVAGCLINANAMKSKSFWMASPELALVSDFAEVEVLRVYQAGSFSEPLESIVGGEIPHFTPGDQCSISAGLYAEGLLRAVCSGPIGRTPSVIGHALTAAWMASVARSRVLEEALYLVRNGAKVTGLGLSELYVEAMPSELPNLVDMIAMADDLALPLNMVLDSKGVDQ